MKLTVHTILSLPRSGTSLATRILGELGGTLPTDAIPAHPEINPEGFFESTNLLKIRSDVEMLLSLNFSFPSCWTPVDWNAALDNEKIRELRDQAADYFLNLKQMGVNNFIFKDPRTVAILPFWSNVFESIDINNNYILVVREPLSVSASISKFNNHSIEMGILLWIDHMCSAIQYLKYNPTPIVIYNHWFENKNQIQDICIHVFGKNIEKKYESNIKNSIIKPELNRNFKCNTESGALYEFSDMLYKEMENSEGHKFIANKSVLKKIDDFVELFKVIGQIMHPMKLEKLLDFDRRNFEMEQKVDQLKSELEFLKQSIL